MLVFFRSHQEMITRNHDFTAGGFSPLPSKKNQIDEKFHWSLELIRDMASIFSSMFISAVAYGILMVLIALKLEFHVKNEILMSFSAAVQIGAGVIFSRFLPSLGHKVGMIRSIHGATIVSAICALLLFKYHGFFLWILVIFALGTSLFTCGVTRATIMIDLAPQHIRALIISLGNMSVAIGNAIGSVVLGLMNTNEEFSSFFIVAMLYLLSMIPLTRLKNVDSKVREEKKISIWRYIKNSPKIMFAGFSVSYAMSSASAFLIVYGIKIGMPQSQAAMLLSVLLFGTILYIPIGYITDIFNRRMLMILFAALSLVCVCLLYVSKNEQDIYLLLFLMFGCLSGMKLPAIVLINEKYKSTQRLAVNSAFSRVSLIGNIFGLLLTGAIMKTVGAKGLWISLIMILFLFLLFCSINYLKKAMSGELSFKNISIRNQPVDEKLQES
ncbi:MAG: MFS transporter [Proteobacteria bacterium]|nr:MFS transporter [Pseudomonadota bacterium]